MHWVFLNLQIPLFEQIRKTFDNLYSILFFFLVDSESQNI